MSLGERLLRRSRGGRGRRRRGGRRLLLLKLLALQARLRLELFLQLFILLLKHLGIDRGTFGRRREFFHRKGECDFLIGLISHDDRAGRGLLQRGGRGGR